MKKKTIFRFVDHSCIWVSRNMDGTVDLWSSEPIRKTSSFEGDVDIWLSHLDDYFYPGLTFDNSPMQLYLDFIRYKL